MDLDEKIRSREQAMFENGLSQLTKENRTMFSRARRDGYLIISRTGSKIESIYREYCMESYKPAIVLKRLKKFCYLQIDMFPVAMLGKKISSELLDLIAEKLEISRERNSVLNPGYVEVKMSSYEDAEYLAQISSKALLSSE